MTAEEHRAFDARVAEEVMGFEWYAFPLQGHEVVRALMPEEVARHRNVSPSSGDEPRAADWDRWLPFYSTDIADAWKVVEAMRKIHFFIGVHPNAGGYKAGEFLKGTEEEFFDSDEAPLAICRVALLAAENEEVIPTHR